LQLGGCPDRQSLRLVRVELQAVLQVPLPDVSSTYGSLGPPKSSTQTASWSFQPLLQGSVWQTDRHADRPRHSVGNNRQHNKRKFFRLYGRKLSVKFRYFPSVQTEVSVIIPYFLSVRTEIYSYISLFSIHRDGNWFL